MKLDLRSLGNTSILCDAKNKKAVINLNLNLKKASYQPLAPVLLEKDFQKYFSINKNVEKIWSGWVLCVTLKNNFMMSTANHSC